MQRRHCNLKGKHCPHSKGVVETTGNAQVAQTSTTPTWVKWELPPLALYKVNFDGSVHKDKAAAGFLRRNDRAQILMAAQVPVNTISFPNTQRNGLIEALVWTGNKLKGERFRVMGYA